VLDAPKSLCAVQKSADPERCNPDPIRTSQKASSELDYRARWLRELAIIRERRKADTNFLCVPVAAEHRPRTVREKGGQCIMLRSIPNWKRCKLKPGLSMDEPATAQEQWAENFELLPDDRRPLGPSAALSVFVSWLIECGELEGFTARTLWRLYGEFCLLSHTEPLGKAQFFRRIRGFGIGRYRETTGARRRLYRVRTANIVQFKNPSGSV
jgi:hypothetical protein